MPMNENWKKSAPGYDKSRTAALPSAKAPTVMTGAAANAFELPALTAEQEQMVLGKVMGDMDLAPMAGAQNGDDVCCFCVTQYLCLVYGITIDETTGTPAGVALCEVRCGQCTEGIVTCPVGCRTNGACTFCVARNVCATIQVFIRLGANGLETRCRICRIQSCEECVPGCGPCPTAGPCACPPTTP